MQQYFQCISCGVSVGVGTVFCGNCGKQLNWGVQQPSQQITSARRDSPSMHIIPLNYDSKEPVLYYVDGKLNLPAITTNGRLSWLTAPGNLTQGLFARIEERYPPQQYSGVQSYLMCAVNVGQISSKEMAFIFDVWGFWEHFKEIDDLYNVIYSFGNAKVGDVHWNQSVQYLATDPVKTWINTLIYFLKEQLNWAVYVAQVLEYYETISK